MIETQIRPSYVGTYISSWLSRASIIALLGITLAACGGGGGGSGSPSGGPAFTGDDDADLFATVAKFGWTNPANVTLIEINRTTYATATSTESIDGPVTIRTINVADAPEFNKTGPVEFNITSLEIGDVDDGEGYHEFTITPTYHNVTSNETRKAAPTTIPRIQLSFPRVTDLKAELIDGGPVVTLSWTNPADLPDVAEIERLEVNVSVYPSRTSADAIFTKLLELDASATSRSINTSMENPDATGTQYYRFRVRPVFSVGGAAEDERIAAFTGTTPARLQITIEPDPDPNPNPNPVVPPTNTAPMVTIDQSAPVVHDRGGDEFTIEVTATKQDTEGTEVSFPTSVTAGACTAVLVKADGTPGVANPVRTYPANSVGSEVTVTYSVTNPTSDITCGTFSFTATEDGEESEVAATYRGLRFVAIEAPELTTDPNSDVVHDREGDNFTIAVTAMKQDTEGTEVSFPLSVTSTDDSTAELTACVANLDQTGISNINTTHAILTYASGSATVTYNVTNPTEDTNCGTFTFNATEDGKTGSDTYSGLRLENNKKPTVTTVPTDGGDHNRAALGGFPIRVTATKQDSLGSEVRFPLSITPSQSPSHCTANLIQTGGGLTSDGNNYVISYPTNRTGQKVTVTYTVSDPRVVNRNTVCLPFTFSATEDGKKGEAGYTGLRFTFTDLAPNVATNGVTVIHDSADDFTIEVTAMNQDSYHPSEVSFPLVVDTGVTGCTANLDRDRLPTGASFNSTHATMTYTTNADRTVTYNVPNPQPLADIVCGTFRFTATEDSITTTPLLLTNATQYSGLTLRFTPTAPAVTTTAVATIVSENDPSFPIAITARKQDPVGDVVRFPGSVTSAGGCLAELDTTTGAPVQGDLYEWSYEGSPITIDSNRTVTYNVPYPGTNTICGDFNFTATEDGVGGFLVYSGLIFSDGDLDNDGLVDIRTAADLDNIRDHIVSSPCGANGCRGYELLNDIDLSGYENWVPIGNPASDNDHLHGIFEGNGNVISNLTIDIQEASGGANSVAGLFGAFAGDIRNLRLSNVTISAPQTANVGALVGVYRGSGGSISNSTVTGDAINGKVTNDGFAGGVIGRALSNLTMDNVRADFVNISGNRVGGLIGSFVGDAATDDLEIVDSEAFISQIKAGDVAGGLVGRFTSTSSSDLKIVNSDVDIGEIEAGAVAGGLLGVGGSFLTSIATFTGTIEIGRPTVKINNIISKNDDAGGIIGGAYNVGGGVDVYAAVVVADSIQGKLAAGGVIGGTSSGYSTTITSSTVIAKNINGADSAGGLVGYAGNTEIRSSSAIVDTIGSKRSGGLTRTGIARSQLAIYHSFAVNREISGSSAAHELAATPPNNIPPNSFTIPSSFWQNTVTINGAMSSSGQDKTYFQLGGAAGVGLVWRGANAGWCNPTTGEYVLGGEVNPTAPSGYAQVWHFSNLAGEYPAVNCLSITTDDQRDAIDLVQSEPSQSPLTVFDRQFRSQ